MLAYLFEPLEVAFTKNRSLSRVILEEREKKLQLGNERGVQGVTSTLPTIAAVVVASVCE